MPGNLTARTAAALLYALAASLPLALSLVTGTGMQETPARTVAFYCLQMAFALFALQPVLAARLRALDRIFGLDNVYLFHKVMGTTAASVLLTGFLLLAADIGSPRFSMLHLFIPTVASLIAAVLAVTALLYRQLHLNFETWRVLHNVLAVSVLVLGFVQLVLFMHGGAAATTATVVLLIVGVAFYIKHKFIGPARRRSRPYKVEEIRQEAHNVWTLRLTPPEGDARFGFHPGQFQFLRFLSPELPHEEHPFTIASSPGAEGWHESTIKESGDFTSRISRVKAGDPIAVQAPFGRFTYTLYPNETRLVFVAGGIGITPLMSMLRHMRDTRAEMSVTLLWANKTEKDIVFRKELDEIASGGHPRLKVVHVLSRADESWSGERGHIDAALIKRHLEGDAKDHAFWVCGPPPMMAAAIQTITGLGVPPSRVRSERFAL